MFTTITRLIAIVSLHLLIFISFVFNLFPLGESFHIDRQFAKKTSAKKNVSKSFSGNTLIADRNDGVMVWWYTHIENAVVVSLRFSYLDATTPTLKWHTFQSAEIYICGRKTKMCVRTRFRIAANLCTWWHCCCCRCCCCYYTISSYPLQIHLLLRLIRVSPNVPLSFQCKRVKVPDIYVTHER